MEAETWTVSASKSSRENDKLHTVNDREKKKRKTVGGPGTLEILMEKKARSNVVLKGNGGKRKESKSGQDALSLRF